MMKSIDKLREHMRKHGVLALPSDILGYIDAIEKKLAERYTELLEGDRGEVWRIGDMAQSKKFPHMRPKRVCGTGVINGKPVLFYAADDGGHCSEEHKGWDYASCMRHYRQDTFENIINEAVAVGMDGGLADTSILVARCKALAKEGA